MNYLKDKYLLISTNRENKHYRDKSVPEYLFSRCGIFINDITIDIDKAIDVYSSSPDDDFILSIRDKDLYINNIIIGSVYYADWFSLQTSFSRRHFLRFILHLKQLNTYSFKLYTSNKHTMLMFINENTKILTAMKNIS